MLVNISDKAKAILTAMGDERKTFDTAVPQSFADEFRAKTGLNTIGNIVWYYPAGNAFGMPLAVNPEAYSKLLIYYATK
jgi:hypothetical protein